MSPGKSVVAEETTSHCRCYHLFKTKFEICKAVGGFLSSLVFLMSKYLFSMVTLFYIVLLVGPQDRVIHHLVTVTHKEGTVIQNQAVLHSQR